MKEIKKGFKVSISGTGADDELFTGYYDHYLLQLSDLQNTKYYNIRLNEWNKEIKPFVRNK